MGERTISREELSPHHRDRVISKATPVFARRGYRPTTVDDLLAAAKVGVGNFYSVFEGKEDCFLACFDRAVTGARDRIGGAISGSSGWGERSYLGLGAMLAYICEEPLAARLVLVEAQSAGARANARYQAILDEAVAWLAAGRRAHTASSELPPSFEDASVSGLAFYLQLCLLQPERPSPSRLVAETAALILEPIVGAAEFERLVRERADFGRS